MRIVHTRSVLGLLFAGALLVGALAGATVNKNDLQLYLNSLNSLKPEIHADILLALSSGAAIDSKQRVNLAIEAFYIANSLENASDARVASGVYTDSDAALRARALALKLDRLSVKTRVVDEVIKYDPNKALDLFSEISTPAAPPTSCGDLLIPDVTSYYITLGHLLASPQLSKRSIGLVSNAFRPHPSVPDLLGLLTLFRMENVRASDFQGLSGYLETELSSAEPDPSAFQTLLPELQPLLQDAVRVCGHRLLSNRSLLTAIRSFLITQTHETLCETAGNSKGVGTLPQRLAEFYNSRLVSQLYPEENSISQLTPADLTPIKMANPGKARDIWRSSGSMSLLAAVRRARDVLTTHADPDAINTVRDVLRAVDSWRPEELSSEELFHAKAILYFTLLSAAQSTPAYSTILESYVSFLEQEDRSVPPLVWLLHAKELLSASLKSGASIIAKDPALIAYQTLAKLQDPSGREAN